MADQKTEESPTEKVPVSPAGLPAVTEVEREIAQQATEEFENGNYELCSNHLEKLSATRSADLRLIHNKAVLEFYQSGCTKTDEYMKVIAESQVDINNLAALDDVDQCALFYNHAILLYHMRQYKTAIEVMDKLFTFIEPMEEGLSRKVLFLFIELYLCAQQPEKAMGMINAAEKSLFGNGKSQQQNIDGTKEKDKDKDKEKEVKEKEPKEKESKETPPETPTDIWRTRLSMET